ncbi:TPA: TniB family NTP-binding protein [Stenotrophomonas maltophilia]|nr:TniB family NTP-binding protein [Stenotrophomonas maltophilia]HEL4213919.1 TniB family NTP-binding protein [Stenotrophomonas maltophilia]HEL4270522.1 TniB family NTP-binding protein [Stenotrophomonas maltophilia]HEL4301670.1 TniB family NTP-binding protein [Stenotrophomonas maltophilia]HEL4814429.1 TniB family NTP-binding protein [Stenotrophomonas maltophilia]
MTAKARDRSDLRKFEYPFIPHARFMSTQSDLMRSVARAQPGDFIWVIAPSWSGKSELRRQLLPALAGKPAHWRIGSIPLISVRAVLNQGDKFNPKDFALRLHQEITEPEIGWLRVDAHTGSPDRFHEAAELRATSKFWQEIRLRNPERELRLSFERMAKARGLRYIIIDEVANICRVQKTQSARNYMLGIMALIEEIGCTAIMFGTHEAAPLYEHAQEIFNRSDILYMRPYNLSASSELADYAALIKAIGNSLPLAGVSLLQDNLELIALNGGGVFGPTLRYLRRANEERSRAGSNTLNEDHLRAASGTLKNHNLFWADIDSFNLLANAKRSHKLSEFLRVATDAS